MELLNRLKNTPRDTLIIIGFISLYSVVSFAAYLLEHYTISELLGVSAFTLLIISMSQDNIIKLRIYGAFAGLCFMVQFLLSDLPIINAIGQGGLVVYGIYKAMQESKVKKEKA